MPKVSTSKVNLSSGYKRKLSVRDRLHDLVENSITSGEVSNQDELKEFLDDLQGALEALRAVPYEIFIKNAQLK